MRRWRLSNLKVDPVIENYVYIAKKTFKNTNTLSRHCAKYHLEEPIEKQKRVRIISDAISNIIKNIETDLCIDDDTRRQISQYDINNLGISLTNELNKIFKQLTKNGDADEFYSSYYASITLNAALYFPNRPHPSCATFAIKLADKLLASTHDQPIPAVEEGETGMEPEELSEMELGGLQYLAGYVIKNLIGKAKRWTKKCDPKINELFDLFIADDATGQTLIMANNRGGLTAVTTDGQNVFIEIERKFRSILQAKKLSDLRVKEEIEGLVTDNKVVANFLIGIGRDHTIFPQDIKSQCLEMILELYFLIRINSIIKDIKHSKEKGLRKTIKGPKEASQDK